MERTDEENPLTGKEIIEILESNGIKEERKTLYDDIATLSESGLSIEVTKKGTFKRILHIRPSFHR